MGVVVISMEVEVEVGAEGEVEDGVEEVGARMVNFPWHLLLPPTLLLLIPPRLRLLLLLLHLMVVATDTIVTRVTRID